MIGLIILVGIGTIVGLCIGITSYEDDLLSVVGLGFFGAVVGLLVSVLMAIIVEENVDKEIYKKYEEPLYAISDTENFYLGRGSINEKMGYVFRANGEGGKVIQSIEADMTFVNEDDNEEPRIEYYWKRNKNKAYKQYFFGIFDDNHEHNVIYIPEDSINYKYNIDLD